MQQTTAKQRTFQIYKRLLKEQQDGPTGKILHVAARLNPKMNLIKPALRGQFF